MTNSRAEYHKKWYQLNKEKKAEYHKKYYELNKEKRAEQIRKYDEKNKEKRAEYDKKYREENRENRIEYEREYREENRERINTLSKELAKKYRKEKKAICLEYLGGKCVVCGTTERLEFDHIKREGKKYSIASKLSYKFDNLKEELDKCQLLCAPCHLDKTAKEWTILCKMKPTQRGD